MKSVPLSPMCVRVGCSYLIHQFLKVLQSLAVIFVVMFIILIFCGNAL